MSSSALRTFAFALIVLSVLFGVVAYFMSRQIDAGPDAGAEMPMPQNDSVLAVVAIRPLRPYQPVMPEDVSLVPISIEPPSYFTNVDNVVGRTPVRAVDTGAPVTEAAFGRRNALAESIPPGTQAMSLEVSDVIAVGGFVQPGDFVDVLLYLRSSGDQVDQSQARLLLEDVRVLAYQQELINAGEGDAAGDSAGRRQDRTAVLAVPEDQTTRVMLGASLGELRLSLRAPRREQAGDMPSPAVAGMPSAVSPAAARDDDDGVSAAAGSTDNVDREQAGRVITLAQLSRIEQQRRDAAEQPSAAPRRNAPRRTTIEVYEGAKSSRVTRPY